MCVRLAALFLLFNRMYQAKAAIARYVNHARLSVCAAVCSAALKLGWTEIGTWLSPHFEEFQPQTRGQQ
jgi:ABC-type uncharacterized transport system substrate-binding protein